MDPAVEEILPKLKAAVEITMNPMTSPQDRMEAYKACEDFKENSNHCVPCGLVMCEKQESDIIRHFGLQLLEHSVKSRWYKMTPEEKLLIKDHTMKLMAYGTHDLLTEHAHIKDGLTRVVVEMAKREWPQQWPSLLQELSDMCSLGETQTELVLLTLLRMAEDLLLFQTVPTQRRREMVQELTSRTGELFSFFVRTLTAHNSAYQELKNSGSDTDKLKAKVHCKVALSVLQTVTAYLDWVNMSFIVENGGLLLQMLCQMLTDDQLQLFAAECLLIITSRKGKAEERRPILMLFDDEAMKPMFIGAGVASSQADKTEYHYLFLKKLCQVLTSIGSQLCSIWDSESNIGRPKNFQTYLDAILEFTCHPSQTNVSFCQVLWASFLRHDFIKDDEIFISVLPKVVKACKENMYKVGHPSSHNSPSCSYSRMEFDSDEDFNNFFTRYRAEVANTVRFITLKCPTLTFQTAAEWLNSRLQTPLNMKDGDHCNLSSPVFLEWEAVTSFTEAVMSRLPNSNEPKPPAEEGIKLLKALLSYECQDPLILSCVLSCISALFPYISDAPETLPIVLDKIFSTAVFSLNGQTKATRSRAVKNVRRHACSVLIKVCLQYPHLLLPGFDRLYSHIKQLSSDPNQLSQMEKCTLNEALIIISNEFKNFERQCSFIGEVLAPVKEMLTNPEFKCALWNTDKFIAYVGVDQAPVEPSEADTCGINRSHILYCINSILAFMKRSKWPEDPEQARAGGFMTTTPDGSIYLRNPCMPYIGVMLDSVLALTRTLNGIWLPENMAKRHPEFVKAYDLMETERLCILGIQPPCVDNTNVPSSKNPVERMQHFFTAIHENCYHILGNAGVSLGYELYSAPQLSASLLNSSFTNLEHIPDYRLRPLIRTFLKPYIFSCPKEFYDTAILPLLGTFGPFMLQRLQQRWEIIKHRCQEKSEEEEAREILEDQLTRLLTREYADLLWAVCLSRKLGRGAVPVDSPEEMMGEDETGVDLSANKHEGFNDLGNTVINNDLVYPSLVLCIFQGLSWGDTPCCKKFGHLAWPILRQLSQNQKLENQDACHLFTSILFGLQHHGQFEDALSMLLLLAVNAYELLRPKFPELSNILLQAPNCNPNAVKAFEDKLFSQNAQKLMPDKKKKENFKSLILGIIGKNVSQQFSKNIEIKNLAPIQRRSQPKLRNIVDVETKDIGLCALFQEETNGNH